MLTKQRQRQQQQWTRRKAKRSRARAQYGQGNSTINHRQLIKSAIFLRRCHNEPTNNEMEWHGMPNNREKMNRNSERRRKINETDNECVHKCHLEIYFSIRRRPIVNQLQQVIDFFGLKTTFIALLCQFLTRFLCCCLFSPSCFRPTTYIRID